MHPCDPGHQMNRPNRALSIPLCSAWQKSTDDHGWAKYTRGNCRITVPPSGASLPLTGAIRVSLFVPSGMSEHANVDAAKRAAARSHNRGW